MKLQIFFVWMEIGSRMLVGADRGNVFRLVGKAMEATRFESEFDALKFLESHSFVIAECQPLTLVKLHLMVKSGL